MNNYPLGLGHWSHAPKPRTQQETATSVLRFEVNMAGVCGLDPTGNYIFYQPSNSDDLIVAGAAGEVAEVDMRAESQRQAMAKVLSSPCEKVFIESKPILKRLRAEGLSVSGPFFDLSIAEQVLDSGQNSYKGLGPRGFSDFASVLLKRHHVSSELEKAGLGMIAGLEFSLLPAIAELEANGIGIDGSQVAELTEAHPDYQAKVPWLRGLPQRQTRLYPTYHQIGTATGRITCSNPNVQGVPSSDLVRRCFVAGSGNKLVIGDYSQMELRVAAELSQDRKLLGLFQSGKDLHRHTASVMTGKAYDEVTIKQRSCAKAINFGLLYGLGAGGLATYAQENYSVSWTIKQAEKIRERFSREFSGLRQWQSDLAANTSREVRTLGGRRRCWQDNPHYASLLNAPVQGSAADIFKHGVVNILRKPPAWKLVALVHDEIILEVPEPEAEEAKSMLITSMQNCDLIRSVPLIAEVRISDTWAKA